MYQFILSLVALLIQVYSINLLRNNSDKESKYSFWYNIVSVILSMIAFYIHFVTFIFPVKSE
jgi:hypothetical protein